MAAIVEGHSEQRFINGLLAPHFTKSGVTIWAVLPGKSHRFGGVRRWPSIKGDIIRILKSKVHYCTMFFDYYGLPTDWPGRDTSSSGPVEQKADNIETALAHDVAVAMGDNFDRARFIPYIQMHEFEALLFSDVAILAKECAALSDFGLERLKGEFEHVLNEAGDPEAINDHYHTCPSRRITALVKGYRKALHGPIVVERIGVDAMKHACARFGQWVTTIERLGTAD